MDPRTRDVIAQSPVATHTDFKCHVTCATVTAINNEKNMGDMWVLSVKDDARRAPQFGAAQTTPNLGGSRCTRTTSSHLCSRLFGHLLPLEPPNPHDYFFHHRQSKPNQAYHLLSVHFRRPPPAVCSSVLPKLSSKLSSPKFAAFPVPVSSVESSGLG